MSTGQKDVEVELNSALFASVRGSVAEGFTLAADLTRSVEDVNSFKVPRELPLIRDVLERLYSSTDAERCIYMNIDIALMPNVARPLPLAWTFNKTPSLSRGGSSRVPLPPQARYRYCKRWWHEDHDCFVFRRDVYRKCRLGDACIGIPGMGFLLRWNLILHSRRGSVLGDTRLTIRVEEANPHWALTEYQDYRQHNRGELRRFAEWLQAEHGPM